MANVIIHLGLHKTGTTSIQYFLRDHRTLINKYCIEYPLTREYSLNNINHYHSRCSLDIAYLSLRQDWSTIVFSCEDILPEIGSNSTALESISRLASVADKSDDKIVAIVTLPPSLDILIKRVVMQQSRTHANCTKGFLLGHIYNYLMSCNSGITRLRHLGIPITGVRPKTCRETLKTDIIRPFIDSLPFIQDQLITEFQKINTSAYIMNTSSETSRAKGILYGFVHHALTELRYNGSWWTEECRLETESFFKDFTIISPCIEDMLRDLFDDLVSFICSQPHVIAASQALVTTLDELK